MKTTKLLVLCTTLICVTTAWAENYSVNTDSKLREAIQNNNANITLTADIDLSNSTLSIPSGKTVTINLGGHTLDRKLTKRGEGGGQVITVRSGATLNLSNGTLKGGWGGAGGALVNEGGTVTITDVIMTNNVADDRGGGVCNRDGGTLTMTDCSITNNHSNDQSGAKGGGGFFNETNATATLTNVTITGNEAKICDGGGICNFGTLTIDGGSITNNTGDGIYNEGTLNMKGAITVTGNRTTELLNDNVYLKNGPINVVGSLAGSTISINMVRSGVFTSNYSDYNSGVAPSTYFTADFTNVFGVAFSGTEAALTGGPFYYIDRQWDAENKKIIVSVKSMSGTVLNDAEQLFHNSYDYWLDDGVCVLTGDVNIPGDLVMSGGRHGKILLCDGSQFSIDFSLRLVAWDRSDTPILCIYGQMKNSGLLHVLAKTVERYRAGIGTDTTCDEPLNIYGGTIDVKGTSKGGAGIGTAPGVNPTSKRDPILREINIYGGIIKAQGGPGAAGIGSGAPGGAYSPEDYGNINIYGGTITATGGGIDNYFSADVSGAGIGGGGGNHQGNLHIYGGNITATGGLDAAGIGCGQSATSAGNITIEGGYVYAQGNDYGAGIGGGEDCAGANVTITGGTVIAKAGYNETGNRAIGPGHGSDNYGQLTLGDDIMVSSERMASASERKNMCWYRTQARIEPCTHDGHTYTISGTTASDTHTLECNYCMDHTTELHNFHNGTCTVCGVGATAYTVRIYLPKDLGGGTYDGQTYSSQTMQMIPGSTFPMPPSPTTVPGLEFKGWEVSSVTSDTYTSTYTSTDGGTILDADDEYTINSNVSFIARYEELHIVLYNDTNNGEELSKYDGRGVTGVTLNGRTLTKNGDWNTLCLPFSVDDISITPLADATVKTLNSTSFAGGTLTMNFTEDGNNLTSLEAGKPYIVKWKTDLLIDSQTAWDTFAENVNSGTDSYEGKIVRMANSITVSTMVGTSANPFKGTFDGRGYTLTFNKSSEESHCAPFRYVDGATIKSLNIGGTINASHQFAAGLIAYNKGNTTVSNCRSSVTINSTLSGDGTHGGFIARLDRGAVTISNCLFDGTLSGNKTTNCGGFVGWTESNNGATVTFNNCLFNPAAVSLGSGCKTYARVHSGNPTINNSYYKKTLGDAQGTNATSMSDDDLLSNLGSGWMVRNGNGAPKMPPGSEHVFYDVTINNTLNHVETQYADFVGNFSPVEIDGEDKSILYLGAGNKLYYPSAAMSIKSFRGYFQLKGITAGDVTNARLFFGDDTITGIVGLDNLTYSRLNNSVYDLQGRKVSPLSSHPSPLKKGVYIYNGRKLVVK